MIVEATAKLLDNYGTFNYVRRDNGTEELHNYPTYWLIGKNNE
jgi:hypothetical protein